MAFLYYRILGYVVTIVLHVGNMIATHSAPKETLKDPRIQEFLTLQTRYLTGWTFFLQIVHAVTGLICDLLTLSNSTKNDYRLPKHLKGFKDTLFSAIVWPSSVLVSLLFWTVYLYDRSLVFPEYLDKILSPISNHIMHTAIVPVALWEALFRPRTKPRSHKKYLAHLLFYFTLYILVLFYTYFETGKWLYPVLGKIYGTVYFPFFIAFCLFLALLCYNLQWVLVSVLWTPELPKKVR